MVGTMIVECTPCSSSSSTRAGSQRRMMRTSQPAASRARLKVRGAPLWNSAETLRWGPVGERWSMGA